MGKKRRPPGGRAIRLYRLRPKDEERGITGKGVSTVALGYQIGKNGKSWRRPRGTSAAALAGEKQEAGREL